MSIHFLGMDLDLDEVTKESFSSNVPSVVRLWLGSTVKSETWPMSSQEKWQVEGNQDVAWWVNLEDKDWNDLANISFPNFGVLAPMFSILARQHHHKKHPGFSQTCKPFQWSVRWSKHVQAEHAHFHVDSPWILHGSRPQVAKKKHVHSPQCPSSSKPGIVGSCCRPMPLLASQTDTEELSEGGRTRQPQTQE